MFDEAIEHNAFVHEADAPAKPTAGELGKVGAVEGEGGNKPVTGVGEGRKVVAHFMVSLGWGDDRRGVITPQHSAAKSPP